MHREIESCSVTAAREESSFYHYRAYGTHFRSELHCSRLALSATSEYGVDIVLDNVPKALPNPSAIGYKFQAKPSELLLTTNHIADYFVTNGRKIRVEPKSKKHWETVLSLLWGWATGGVLQQRDRFPFHGSVLQCGQEAVVFCGHSGHGKSAIAMALVERGFRILDDNIALLYLDNNTASVYPGVPELKIYPSDVPPAWQHVVPTKGAFPNSTKLLLDMTPWYCEVPLPVTALFVLSRSDNERNIRLLKGREKIEVLSRHVFCSKFIPGLGKTTELFQFLVSLAPFIRVLEIREPFSDAFPHTLIDDLARKKVITI